MYESIVSFSSVFTDDLEHIVGLMYESIVSFSSLFTDNLERNVDLTTNSSFHVHQYLLMTWNTS